MRLERLDALAVAADRPFARQAQHAGLARAVDVGVENADARAVVRQGQRQVDRDGGLADAALAGSDRDDVADARQRLPAGGRGLRGDFPAHLHPRLPAACLQPGLERRPSSSRYGPIGNPSATSATTVPPSNLTDFTALTSSKGVPR